MNKLSLLLLLAFNSYKNLEIKKESTLKFPLQELITDNYELIKPNKRIKSVVVLFGGFPEKPEDIKREFNILQLAKENSIAIVYMNYNKKLWLEEDEKQKLAAQLQSIFLENKLPKNSLYIGGFSSGGNMSLLIGSFLKANKKFALDPKGIFSIDSPIDLVALYKSSEKNLKQNSSKTSLQESTWIIETLEKQFGNPNNTISKYQAYSVFTSKTNNIDNLKSLKNTKIRLYSEPDTLWWKENRKADYDQMNAFYIKKLYERLKESGFKKVENITTKNKGYRANGERHPHSWSIVDKNDLVQWIIQ
jgi:hypothetical protein